MRGVVALRFLPDLDLVITMLALAKAGLAYIPLAPEWPQGRLELLIDEVRYIGSGTNLIKRITFISFRPIFIVTNAKADILHHAVAATSQGRKPIYQANLLKTVVVPQIERIGNRFQTCSTLPKESPR